MDTLTATQVAAPEPTEVAPDDVTTEVSPGDEQPDAIVAAAPTLDEVAAGDAVPEVEPEVAPSGAPMEDRLGVSYRRWRMPVAVLEGVETGDLREIDAQALTWREFPRPFMVLTSTTMGHDDAELVGRIDSAERVDASQMIDARTNQPYGEGAFAIAMEGVLTNEDLADRVVELIDGGFLRGVSVDMGDITEVVELIDLDGNLIDLETATEDVLLNARLKERIIAGRIGVVTLLPFEAFEGAYIELLDDDGNVGPAMAPGQPSAEQAVAAIRASAEVASPRRCIPCEAGAITAAAAPVEPPAAWFENPNRDRYDRRIVATDEGRVFGYVAPWDVCHTGITGQCIVAPRSAIDYALFTTGSVKTAEGDIIPTGRITLGTGHPAGLRVGMGAAIEHYDNTGTAVADVAIGEDEYGIWFSGALRPDVTPERIRALRGSQLSGDWRPWGGGRELIAALAVNTGGFPVVQQLVAAGQPGALVASFGAMVPLSPELAEVFGLLPELRTVVARDRTARQREQVELVAREAAVLAERAATAGALRAKMRAAHADELRSRMSTPTKESR